MLFFGSFFVLALLTSSFIPHVEAKPSKSEPFIDDFVIITCTENNGILTCTIKSASEGTVGTVVLNKAYGSGDATCDSNISTKKRISVTTRHSENCQEPFDSEHDFNIFVHNVDGNAKNLTYHISIAAGIISIEKLLV